MNRHFEEKKKVEDYKKFRPVYTTELAESILHYMKQKCLNEKHDLMVDIGCGSGQATHLFQHKFKAILALDPSSNQIETAIKHNDSPNIRFEVGIAEKMIFEDESVDLIICAMTAHYIDIPAFLRETRRVLKVGGVLAIFGYCFPIITPIGIDGDKEEMSIKMTQLVEDVILEGLALKHRLHGKVIQGRYKEIYEKIDFQNKIRNDELSWNCVWTRKELNGLILSGGSFDPKLQSIDKFDRDLTQICGLDGEFNVKATFSLFLILAKI